MMDVVDSSRSSDHGVAFFGDSAGFLVDQLAQKACYLLCSLICLLLNAIVSDCLELTEQPRFLEVADQCL